MSGNAFPFARNGLHIYVQEDGRTQIDIFGNQGVVRRHASVNQLGTIFADLNGDTGFLPPNTLFHSRASGKEVVAVLLPAQVWRWITKYEDAEWDLPMPPLIWTGVGTNYYLAAVKDDGWPTAQTAVYNPPTFNIDSQFKICPGSISYPEASPATIYQAWDMTCKAYWDRSYSNARCKSGDLLEFWHRINGAEQFPMDELVAADITLAEFKDKIALETAKW